ncbi:hypothetical protein HDV03_003935 [Kappamyces sp. JEL0829]|nr:hypothetical protein HDV03_003935 [Kappamyces sp. JEL0829]
MTVDIPDVIIPYTTAQLGAEVVHTVVSMVGLVCESLVIYASLQNRNFQSSGTVLVLSLCVADLLFSLLIVVYGVIDIREGGWSMGPTGCLVNAFLVLVTCAVSLLSLFAIALERYLIIINQRIVTAREQLLCVAGIWLGSIAICLIPIATQTHYQVFSLETSLMLCAVAWFDTHPIPLLCSGLTMTIISSSVFGMSYCYTSILYRYWTNNRRKETASQLQMQSAAKTEDMSRQGFFYYLGITNVSLQERKLFLKTTSMSGVFILCWLPYTAKVIYELASQTPSSSEWTAFFNIMASSNPTFNALLLIVFDPRVKSTLMELFGIESKGQKQSRLKKSEAKELVALSANANRNHVQLPSNLQDTGTVLMDSRQSLDSAKSRQGDVRTPSPLPSRLHLGS